MTTAERVMRGVDLARGDVMRGVDLARGDVMRVVVLVAGLGAAVALRWAGQLRLGGEGLVVGAAFGITLLAVGAMTWRGRDATVVSGGRPRARTLTVRHVAAAAVRRSLVLAVGVLVGLLLVLIAAGIRGEAMPSLRPAVPYVPWVLVTVLVATSEEALLRGALFGAVDRLAGPVPALIVTSVLFAAMHVPFYGPIAVPLDLAVGMVFGGLRLATRGVTASIAAHAVADVATWWL